MTTVIRRAAEADVSTVAAMAAEIWSADTAVLTAEFSAMVRASDCAVFLAEPDGVPAGFAQCGLRHDYVEGTDSSPVGYLEGIFVKEEFRRRGIAAALLGACQQWARERGCTEFASDCEEENEDSARFHRCVGFTEVNRIVCFVKKL